MLCALLICIGECSFVVFFKGKPAQSTYLQSPTSFLSQNVFNKISINSSDIRFSSTSNIMMHQLFNNISYADRTYNINNIKTENLDLKTSDLPKGVDCHPYSILRFALTHDSPYPIPPVSQAIDPQKEYNLARSRILKHRKRFNRK